MTLWIALAVLALFALLYVNKRGKVSAQPKQGWLIGPIIRGKNYSVGMPARPTMQGAGWFIDFPQSGHVDYVQHFGGRPSFPLRYSVTGSGFQAIDGGAARVGVCLQRKGDDWSGAGKFQQFRLYGQDRPLLVAGDGQLAPAAWTDVRGQVVSQTVVDAVLADLDNYAIVFGGQFAGHGVSGSGRFTLG